MRDNDTQDELSLSTPEKLQAAMAVAFDPAEFELVDAMNRMERGDYSGAVRRVCTAIEAELERVLRNALLRVMSGAEVEEALRASQTDFPGRLRQYARLRREAVPPVHQAELEQTRSLRHEIVHRGLRIQFAERGRAQRAVDTGRWFFNWLQQDEERTRLRERGLGLRSLGRNLWAFPGQLTPDGPIIFGLDADSEDEPTDSEP